MSGSGSRSTYRSKAILRSTLPSGARLISAVICCRSSPCRHSGSTTRAAATGSTEPEGLRQLSGVAHHYGDVTEIVCFREVKKTSVCVCSACHDKLLSARNKWNSPDWEENAKVYKPGFEVNCKIFFSNRFAIAFPYKIERRKQQKLCKDGNEFRNQKSFCFHGALLTASPAPPSCGQRKTE